MATLSWFEPRKCWRINFSLTLRSQKVRRAKYAPGKAEATVLATQLGRLEQATRTGMATQQEIEEWIERGWIGADQAGLAFTGYAESATRKARRNPAPTDHDQLLKAYSEYAAQTCKGGALSRNYAKNMSQARQVIGWLKAEWPNLSDLTPEAVRARLLSMKDHYTESSLRHFLIKTHLLLDHAMNLGMVPHNTAREVRLRRDLNVRVKSAKSRRILSREEAERLLAVSLEYPRYLNGGLPAVVRLGLYAGMRNEEMCWFKWGSIDWERRILSVQESVCELTGETWVPKDYEARRIDVKQVCIDYLRKEKDRQTKAGVLGPFVLSAGKPLFRTADDRLKPMHPDTPSKAFGRMIREAGWDTRITVYSMRHTYATMALRSGVDLRTLQKRMGHADLKTTMEYLHFIEPEAHPMNKLPY